MGGVLTESQPAVNWAVKRIAIKEGSPHPTDLGMLANLHSLAEMVSSAPVEMLDSALDQLLSLMSDVPPDAALPILSRLISRRPDAISLSVEAGGRLGGRVRHIEKALYVQFLFSARRVQVLTESTQLFLKSIRGNSDPEMI